MKPKRTSLILKSLFVVMVCSVLVFQVLERNQSDQLPEIEKIRSSGSPKAQPQSVKGRAEYFFNMLRDPATNQIPADILQNEIDFTRNIQNRGLMKISGESSTDWKEAGPNDVGGRTRALALDIRNSDIVLAGGVSGGVWKSTDRGKTWDLKFTTSQVLSVTSIAQDIRPGYEDTWYASAGEYSSNSASTAVSYFRGVGLYKSIDNGETWQLTYNENNDATIWDHPFDYVSNVVVNPQTGSLFLACNGSGIYRLEEDGVRITKVLGGYNQFVEIDISADGTMVAALSEKSSSSNINPAHQAGIWESTDDGENWAEITPLAYPTGVDYKRAVVDIAPSNTNICYVLLNVDDTESDNRLFKINIRKNTSIDLSANLPYFPQVSNYNRYTSQDSYDMLIAVKPDDENFVIIGGTSLYRSFDGFSTPLNDDVYNHWIGGYANNNKTLSNSYRNFHPDVHSFAFDLAHPDTVWFGTDGGLSYTNNISALNNIDFTEEFEWKSKNNGYNVTQSYGVAIPKTPGDNRILTGTQDNGTPFFRFDGTVISGSRDVSTGDGGYSYFGTHFVYGEGVFGSLGQLGYLENGDIVNAWQPVPDGHAAFIFPKDATGQIWMNPFAVDPADENFMYYPAGSSIWRNNSLNSIENFSGIDPQTGARVGITFGWSKLENLEAPADYFYTAMDISNKNNSHVLYYAAYNPDNTPILYRLDDANVNTGAASDISVPGLVSGAYIQDIAVNPKNSDEILVVATNYHIVGLYHSTDGGVTYDAVEGNLRGENDKGPSLRSAVILPTDNEINYFVGTSVGLFSTTALNDENTIWLQEGSDVIGNVVVADLDARTSDNYIAVGTHGRGVFTGTLGTTVEVEQPGELPATYALSQNYPNPFNPSTTIRIDLPEASNVRLEVFNMLGEIITVLLNGQLQAGNHSVKFNGASIASGTYIYRMTAKGKNNNFTSSKKFVLLK